MFVCHIKRLDWLYLWLSLSCSHVNSGHSAMSALCTPSSLTVSSAGHTHALLTTSKSVTSPSSVCPQYTNVDSLNSLAPSSMPFSSPPVSALTGGSISSLASVGNSLHASGLLGHGTNGTMPSGVRTAPLLSSSSSKGYYDTVIKFLQNKASWSIMKHWV